MLKGLIDFSWTLFLDRDGVINKRVFGGYITHVKDFEFNLGVLDFLQFAHLNFHRIVIVTNQQGVGKGIMSENDLSDIHRYMISKVIENHGRIDKVYTATNLKNDQKNSRKPLPNMGYKAQDDFPTIDFSKSVMIGDTNSDLLFGKNLGMKTVLVKSDEFISESSDFQISNLTELIF